MTDIEYYGKIKRLLRDESLGLQFNGDHFDRESDYHRMVHETQKRLADAGKAKMDEGIREIAEQVQRDANEVVEKIFGFKEIKL